MIALAVSRAATSSSSCPSSRAEHRARRRRGARTRRHSGEARREATRLQARDDPSTGEPRPHSSHLRDNSARMVTIDQRCAREVCPCVSPTTPSQPRAQEGLIFIFHPRSATGNGRKDRYCSAASISDADQVKRLDRLQQRGNVPDKTHRDTFVRR